jgi:hypothetical protein
MNQPSYHYGRVNDEITVLTDGVNAGLTRNLRDGKRLRIKSAMTCTSDFHRLIEDTTLCIKHIFFASGSSNQIILARSDVLYSPINSNIKNTAYAL